MSAAVDSTAEKDFATLQARAAMLGHQLRTITLEHRQLFEVSRWGQARTFSHLGDVEAFLRQVGGSHDRG